MHQEVFDINTMHQGVFDVIYHGMQATEKDSFTLNRLHAASVAAILVVVVMLAILYMRTNSSSISDGSSSASEATAIVQSPGTAVDEDQSIRGSLGFALTWMMMSGTITMYNAWLFGKDGGNFPYVICLCCWHQALNSALMFFVRMFFPDLMPAARDLAVPVGTLIRAVSVPAMLLCFTLVLGNKAYLYLSVPFIQMVKSAMPMMTYGISCLFGLEVPTRSILTAVALIITGVCLTVTGELRLDRIGICFQMAAFMCEGLRLVSLKLMLSSKGISLDPLSALLFCAPICFTLLLALAFFTGEIYRVDVATLPIQHLLMNGALACGLNIASVCLLRRASATTLAVCGTVKDVTVTLLAIPLMHANITRQQLVGFVTTILAVQLYDVVKKDPQFFSKLRAMKTKAGKDHTNGIERDV